LLRSDGIGGATIVADLEAGLGTLTRMGDTPVDVVLLVVEPSAKSVEVARRAVGLLAARPIEQLVIVVNKVTDDTDLTGLHAMLGDHELVVVADDPEIREADRRGLSPVDHAPGSLAVATVVALGERLAGSR
jgi:CO dehydrogenase maturation factor